MGSRLRGNDGIRSAVCVEGQSPFDWGLGVSPFENSLESLFDKEGLREFGIKGVDLCYHLPSTG